MTHDMAKQFWNLYLGMANTKGEEFHQKKTGWDMGCESIYFYEGQ